MVDKNSLRAAFSARLHAALDNAGIRARGRGVDVQKALRVQGVRKTTQAISKWLNGESIPESDTMQALSYWLKVRRDWLEYGDQQQSGHPYPELLGQNLERHIASNTSEVPILDWAEVKEQVETSDTQRGNAVRICCPIAISPRGFALRVKGDSMTNPGLGRSYPEASIIFVDPAVTANAGDRVIAFIPGSDVVTFKTLVEDAGRTFLRPLNPQYPILDITQDIRICGKVIGSFIPD